MENRFSNNEGGATMDKADMICTWVALLISLIMTLFSLVYGLRHFFKKGKPLFVQSLTLAMGSHALGSLYQLCLMLSNMSALEGFTPAYLGHIGFFLFFITASYGQLDRIVDDGSAKMRTSRFIALIAPICAALLYIPIYLIESMPIETKIACALVWAPGLVSLYFNLKHAIIPNLDFNFIKAIKPYNVFALCLGFSEMIFLVSWKYNSGIFMICASLVFCSLCILTMIAARKGVEQWII